jgi:hypothetical protein
MPSMTPCQNKIIQWLLTVEFCRNLFLKSHIYMACFMYDSFNASSSSFMNHEFSHNPYKYYPQNKLSNIESHRTPHILFCSLPLVLSAKLSHMLHT